MDIDAFYGPKDPTVLNRQSEHRSSDILTDRNKLDVTLKVRCNLKIVSDLKSIVTGSKLYKIRMRLRRMGFSLLPDISEINNHLITALVERWRSETHTFHLRCGEATVTLYDVSMISTLPIDGRVVTGVDSDRNPTEWQDYCERFIGFRPTELKGSKINLKALAIWLLERFKATDESSETEVDQLARAYALLMIGCVMFPDSSGSTTSLVYLQHLENIDVVRNYSWGSAVLAYLYRELCTSCRKGKHNIGGALWLLQRWALTRILPLQHLRESMRTTHGNVRMIREILDNMTREEFVWQPYTLEDLVDPEDSLLSCCRVTCPLIFYHIVEIHPAERVLCQFDMRQSIPRTPPDTMQNLHKSDRRGRKGTDWSAEHQNHIDRWLRKSEYRVEAEPIIGSQSVDDGYYEWYESITRRFISPSAMVMNGGGFQPAGDGVAWQTIDNGLDELKDDCTCIGSMLPADNKPLKHKVANMLDIIGRMRGVIPDRRTDRVTAQAPIKPEHHQPAGVRKKICRRQIETGQSSHTELMWTNLIYPPNIDDATPSTECSVVDQIIDELLNDELLAYNSMIEMMTLATFILNS